MKGINFNSEVTFKNDDNVKIKLINHHFSRMFWRRDNHEVIFRRINTYLIKNKFIDGNIIDLGAWIGDNSIPWALNLKHIIYAIDPSPNNIQYIENMSKINNITNIKTINSPISDKNEKIGLNASDDINHCAFGKEKTDIMIQAVSLDYLHSIRKIENIAYIHLDVEGFEENVIKGSKDIINTFKPIISYEQHLSRDDYKGLSLFLHNSGYNIYLINEILPECADDCRNLFAFPKDLTISIDEINSTVAENTLLSILNWNNIPFNSLFSATLSGKYMSNNILENIKSVDYDEKHIFCVNDNNFTKLIVIDKDKNWLCNKYIMGEINVFCEKTIINTYLSAYGSINEGYYSLEDINLLN